jgi:hypothetical protein
MLEIQTKIKLFESCLLSQNGSYADIMKEEIHDYFFVHMGDEKDIKNFSFLKKLKNSIDIENKVNGLVSKLIMNEHHAGIDDLIYEYTLYE